jgi:hypothetical protein
MYGPPDEPIPKDYNIDVFNKLSRGIKMYVVKGESIIQVYDIPPKVTTVISLNEDEDIRVKDANNTWLLNKCDVSRKLCIVEDSTLETSGNFLYNKVVNKTLAVSSILYIKSVDSMPIFSKKECDDDYSMMSFILVIFIMAVLAFALLVLGWIYVRNVLGFRIA